METSLEARHRSEQQVRQFVADASHELRTPLTTIAGYTELARRRPDDDNLRTALGKVEEESARMTALVEDMLLLARLDDGRPLDREPVDLTRLLVEAVDDARVVGPDHRWRLDLSGAPVEVTGDEQRLHQVITNLLTNARKHTPAGTTVTVTVRADGFDVHDDGPGFPRTSWTTLSSGSPGSTRGASAAPTRGAGPGSGSPSWRRSCARTAARSRWTARRLAPPSLYGYADVVPRLSDNLHDEGGDTMTAIQQQPTHSASLGRSEFERAEARTAHNYHPLPVVVAHAEGAWMTDVDGASLPRPAGRLLGAELRPRSPRLARPPRTRSSTSSRSPAGRSCTTGSPTSPPRSATCAARTSCCR